MDTLYESVGRAIDAYKLKDVGSVVSFQEFDEIVCGLVRDTSNADAPALLLEHLAILGVKPSFVSDGYKIAELKNSNVESPPEPFSFGRSPFEDRPSRSAGVVFLPLVKKESLSKLFAHQVRWFQHPVRPNVMLPLRMCSYFLTVDHPNSRIYVDVPVVFKDNQKEMRIIRVSLNVFETILFSQKSENGNFIQLSRKQGPSGVQTGVDNCGEPSHPDSIWALWEKTYIPYYERAKSFISNQPSFRSSALAVADHLIKFQG